MTKARAIGGIEVRRIIEMEGPFLPPAEMFADATAEAVAPHRHWLEPRSLGPVDGCLVLAVQSFVLRTRHHTILVDTCIGNDKTVEWHPPWHRRSDMTWLRNLKANGLTPANIDFVMCTHLHIDHCGWNTSLIDGRWQPTFPNARYLFARREVEAAEQAGGATFAENVLPILDAGRAELVEDDFELDDEVRLEPTPGHTPGHVAVRLTSAGDKGVITGDLMHSPLQCAHPDWGYVYDALPDVARRTRRRFLETHCGEGTLVLASHFPSPSIGNFVQAPENFRFRYDGEG